MRAGFLLLALAAVLLSAAPARAAKAVPKVPKGWIGMLAEGPVLDSRVNLGRELRAMRRAGVQTVRVPFYGAQAQSSRYAPMDFARTDRFMLAAARARLRVLPTIVTVPSWARVTPRELFSGPSIDGLFFLGGYVHALVGRYGPEGTLWQQHQEVIAAPVRKWQLWNEPLTPVFWFESARRDSYVRLLQVVSPAIHAADPKAKVVLGGIVGINGETLQSLYRAGAGDLFDEVAIHPFTFKVSNVLRLVGLARKVMRENGDARKPIALTEVAWPTAYKRANSSYGFEVTRKEQAVKVRQAFRQLAKYRKGLGISAVVWASWLTTDRGKYTFNYAGLRHLTRKNKVVNKPGYYAFRKVAREISR